MRVVYTNIVLTITSGAGQPCWHWMLAADEISLRILQTRIRRSSEYCKIKELERTTLCHFCIQLCRYVHQSHCLSLCGIIKGGWTNGHRADILRWFKHCRTAQAETGNVTNLSIFWLMVNDAVVQFCRAWPHNEWGRLGQVVIVQRWDSTCKSV